MTHYSDNPGMVRVDYYRPSGKWYMTEAHDMSDFWDEPSVHDAVRKTLERDGRWLPHFTIVVAEPYHKSAYPVMFVAERRADTVDDAVKRLNADLASLGFIQGISIAMPLITFDQPWISGVELVPVPAERAT